MQQNLPRFADLGPKVALTEVDVPTRLPVTSTELLAQKTDEDLQRGGRGQSLITGCG